MKIALIGYGKMGRMIEQIARERGHEIVSVIDVDNDQVFDAMATDMDGDNYISENEILDISDQGITVDDMGGFNGADPNANLYAATDEPDYLDYTNNDIYEG